MHLANLFFAEGTFQFFYKTGLSLSLLLLKGILLKGVFNFAIRLFSLPVSLCLSLSLSRFLCLPVTLVSSYRQPSPTPVTPPPLPFKTSHLRRALAQRPTLMAPAAVIPCASSMDHIHRKTESVEVIRTLPQASSRNSQSF